MKILPLILGLPLLCHIGSASEVEVTYEVFSMPVREAAKLRREKLGGEKSYRRVLDLLRREEVRQETWMTVKMQEGTTTLKEVEEVIYTTEYERSRVIFGTGGAIPGMKQPLFPIPDTASSYDTKQSGNTLEMELQENGNLLRLSLWTTRIGLIRFDAIGKEAGKVEMPRFSVQKLKTQITVARGKTALVGTISPPRDLQKAEEKRVWLAFVTAH